MHVAYTANRSDNGYGKVQLVRYLKSYNGILYTLW